MAIPLFIPMTFVDGTLEKHVFAPYVDNLPLVPEVTAVIVGQDGSSHLSGLYVYTNRWMFALSLQDTSSLMVNGGSVSIYAQLNAPVEVPDGAEVYKNGVKTSVTELEPSPNAVYVIREPNNGSFYALPPATVSTLGGVIVGSGLTVDESGMVQATPGSIAPATSTTLGGVIVGSGLTVNGSGLLSVSVALAGDVTGSGGSSINAVLSATGVSVGTYKAVTVDAKGRVTAGTNPTTLAGFGITDAMPISGGNFTGAVNFAPSINLASAATTLIGVNTSNSITITGTTTITSFGTGIVGSIKSLEFADSLTLTNNANIVIPGGQNIVTRPGDGCEAIFYTGTTWLISIYQRADGTSVTRELTTKSIVDMVNPPPASITFHYAAGDTMYYDATSTANMSINFVYDGVTALGARMPNIGDKIKAKFVYKNSGAANAPTTFSIDGISIVIPADGTAAATGRIVFEVTLMRTSLTNPQFVGWADVTTYV